MPKKKFIDKKNAVTFRLVHRSQRDPLIADDDAPQHVLVEQPSSRHNDQTHERPSSSKPKPDENKEKRKEEQRTFGIFFDDDYDYLQHLKDVREVSLIPVSGLLNNLHIDSNFHAAQESSNGLVLPSSVFASNVEENVGLLNRAAPIRGPRPDLDPDIVAALDSDFSDNDELDDDFVVKANVIGSDDEIDSNEDSDEYNESDDEAGELFEHEETKSRFTNYSLTSSVLSRNKGLQLVDEQFERMYEQYDDEQIGALDGDETADGFMQPGNEVLDNALKEFQDKLAESKICLNNIRNESEAGIYDSSSEDEAMEVTEEPVAKWDCESILSHYSTLYNHPKLISEPSKIRLTSTSIPKDVLNPKRGLTSAALARLDKAVSESNKNSGDRIPQVRPSDETPEEKRERKRAVREQRKERRMEKKANVIAFKEEKKRQTQIMLNIKQNVKGIKLT